MFKILTFFSIALLHLVTLGSDIVILPLFTNKNWVAGLNIPLQVKGIELTKNTPVHLEIVPGSLTENDCKVMRDPMIPQNFILRCLKEGSVSLRININPVTLENPKAQTSVLKFGPITISKLEGLKIPIEIPEPNKVDPDWLYGKSIWLANCSSCHTNEKSKMGASASDDTQHEKQKEDLQQL